MKKYFLATLLTLIVLTPATSVEAVGATTSTTTREAKWAEMDARRTANKAQFEERRTDLKAKQTALREDMAKRKLANTVRLMRAAIVRLENAIKRIEARITKVDEQGGDTSEAEGYITLAKADLGKAKQIVDTFASIEPTGATLQENFERIRTAAAQARELIRSAHKNTMLALRSLMKVNVDDDEDSEDGDEE